MLEFTKSIAKYKKIDRAKGIIDILRKNNINFRIDTSSFSFENINNIIVELNPGKNKKIVIGAHYDNYLESTPGANDNAAACAIILKLITNLKSTNKHIEFVFFDFEEYYQKGSKKYLEENKNDILYVINLDMCGLGENIVLSYDNENYINKNTLNTLISKHNAILVKELPTGDAHTFRDSGIETLYIVNSTNNDVEFFKEYYKRKFYKRIPDFFETMHNESDTVDTLNFEQAEKIYNFVIDLINNI